MSGVGYALNVFEINGLVRTSALHGKSFSKAQHVTATDDHDLSSRRIFTRRDMSLRFWLHMRLRFNIRCDVSRRLVAQHYSRISRRSSLAKHLIGFFVNTDIGDMSRLGKRTIKKKKKPNIKTRAYDPCEFPLFHHSIEIEPNGNMTRWMRANTNDTGTRIVTVFLQ